MISIILYFTLFDAATETLNLLNFNLNVVAKREHFNWNLE